MWHRGGVDPLLTATGALAFSVLSAVTQVVPMEAYLLGLGLLGGGGATWLVAASAGVGHGVGKLTWYEVGRAAHRWPRFQRWLERPRVRRTYARWLQAFERRPRLVLLLLGASATVGVPPLTVTPTIAGQLRVGRVPFVVVVSVGRTLFFAAVLGAIGWVIG